jgi:SAM-dependent methyltransferase
MRTTLFNLLEALTRAADFPEPVYEFGAFRVPGQEHLPYVRDFFPGKKFVGCDLRPGPGVDEIQDLHDLALPDQSIGSAILFDTVEHVREPWRALAEVHRCLKPGGILLMSSVWYFPIHAYPDDYWRFTASGFSTLLQDFHPLSVGMCGLKRLPHTVFGVASKGPIDPAEERAVQAAAENWMRHGSRSWKETMLEVAPPVVLIPAYDLFLRMMKLLPSRGRKS